MWLRIGASLLLVTVFLVRADPSAVVRAWREADVRLLVGAVAVQLAGVAWSAMKWRTIVGHERAPRYGWFLRTYLVGQFANNLVPSTIGGDAWRVLRLGRRGGGLVHASATVLVERVTGLLALLALANAAMVVAAVHDEGVVGPWWIPWALAVVDVVTVVAIALAATWSGRVPAAVPGFARGHAERMVSATRLATPRGARLWAVLGMSAAFQASWVLVHVLCGWAIGIHPPVHLFVLLSTMTDLFSLAPVSFNGLGVRELMFTVYLSRVGVDTSTAVAFAFVVFTVRLAVSALGGIVIVTERRRHD